MKRCFAMLLAALMLLPAIAFADALPYARQMYQNTYVHTLFIAPETYGRACISPYAVSSMASGRRKKSSIRIRRCAKTPSSALWKNARTGSI